MTITINPAFKDRKVAHHNTCKSIGGHNEQELLALAVEARKSGNPVLLDCFVELPPLAQLLAQKTTIEIAVAEKAVPQHAPQYRIPETAAVTAPQASEPGKEE